MKQSCFSFFLLFFCQLPNAWTQALPVEEQIHVDQFGYLPGQSAYAVISRAFQGFNAPQTYQPGSHFVLRPEAGGSDLALPDPQAWKAGSLHDQSGDQVWILEIPGVIDTGSYFLVDLDQMVRSHTFRISPGAYDAVMKQSTRMFYLQRSGTAKPEAYAGPWHHGLAFDQEQKTRNIESPDGLPLLDLRGGWWDAGDCNKYVNFTYGTLHNLLYAWHLFPDAFGDDTGIPESGNGIPDIADEIRWELDWLLRMQEPDGGVHMKMGPLGFVTFSPPDAFTGDVYYGPVISSATRTACSVFAHAAWVFRHSGQNGLQDAADSLEVRAVLAWNWLLAHPGYSNYNNQGFSSANPEVSAYDQDMRQLSAAVFLFALTGGETYHNFIKARYDDLHAYQWDYWYAFEQSYQDALLFYCELPGAVSTVCEKVHLSLVNCLTSNEEFGPSWSSQKDPFGAYFKDDDYVWGSNQFKCEKANLYALLPVYGLASGSVFPWQEMAAGFLHGLHGINPLGLVYLTNMQGAGAERSCTQMYHGWMGDGTVYDIAGVSPVGPAPGYLMGGPNKYYAPDPSYPGKISPPQDQPVQKSFRDWNTSWPENSWQLTEPAIYSQAAYVRLLAGFVQAGKTLTSGQERPDTGERRFCAFPNPSPGWLQIKPNRAVGWYRVVDMFGRIRQAGSCETERLELEPTLEDGWYILELEGGVLRFFLQRSQVR